MLRSNIVADTPATREWAYRRAYPSSQQRTEALPAWLYYDNWERGHGALHGRPPISRIVMPILVRFKRRIARRLNSGAPEAETRQTQFCAYLSAILRAGLSLNALFSWWWADRIAGLVMVPLIA